MTYSNSNEASIDGEVLITVSIIGSARLSWNRREKTVRYIGNWL